jgi:hypothetical protein
MTQSAAGRMQKRGRRLLTAKILTPSDYAVPDACAYRADGITA